MDVKYEVNKWVEVYVGHGGFTANAVVVVNINGFNVDTQSRRLPLDPEGIHQTLSQLAAEADAFITNQKEYLEVLENLAAHEGYTVSQTIRPREADC